MIYQVICRKDMVEIMNSRQKGAYILTSRKFFKSKKEAEEYLNTVDPLQEPQLVTNCAAARPIADAINRFDSEPLPEAVGVYQ